MFRKLGGGVVPGGGGEVDKVCVGGGGEVEREDGDVREQNTYFMYQSCLSPYAQNTIIL